MLHALWNALLRLEREKDRAVVAAIVIASMFAMVVASVRWGLGEAPFTNLRGVIFTIAAGLFEGVYFATLARAMELGRLGVVYTISRGGAVLVVWPMSIMIFAEHATAPAMIGTAIVIGGLTLCGFGARALRGGTNEGAAILWAMSCAVTIAGYHLSYKAALREGVNPSATFALSLSLSAAINVSRLGRAGRRALGSLVRVRWPRLAVMGIACGSSFLILMEALAIGGSGFVLTLRNTSVLFAASMSWWIGEKPSRVELIGAVFVAAGAAMMAL